MYLVQKWFHSKTLGEVLVIILFLRSINVNRHMHTIKTTLWVSSITLKIKPFSVDQSFV